MRNGKKRKDQKREVRTDVVDEFQLRPWGEVARLYREKTGQKLTRGGAWTIGQRAIRKLRNALAGVLR